MSPEMAKIAAELAASPAGFSKQGGDIVGFWDPEVCPIQCKPLFVKLFDSNLEPQKPSMLLTVEITKALPARPAKDEGDELFVAPKGSLIGIWYKPGMRALRDRCGVETWVKQTGEKDTGKPNPMKLYEVTGNDKGTRVPVAEDLRDKSRPYSKGDGTFGNLTDFDSKRPASQSVSNGSAPDELPF